MSIAMQGSWTVSAKFREAFSTNQRFIIAGADSGNGIYDGITATPAVFVTGDAWSITVPTRRSSSARAPCWIQTQRVCA